MTKRYLEVTIVVGCPDQADEVTKWGILHELREMLDIESVKIVPLELCECGGYKREGALMCDACAGGVIG